MRELTSLAEADRNIALDRYQILRPHLEDGRALTEVALDARVTYSTAQPNQEADRQQRERADDRVAGVEAGAGG